jgi:hypothetical protein
VELEVDALTFDYIGREPVLYRRQWLPPQQRLPNAELEHVVMDSPARIRHQQVSDDPPARFIETGTDIGQAGHTETLEHLPAGIRVVEAHH